MTTFIGRYLNPGEVENLLRIERDERRKRRLNQVRQQAREKASKIVLSVKKERDKQLQILSNHLETEWLKHKQEKIEELAQIYGENLSLVGAAHSNVSKDVIAKEVHIKKVEEDNLKTVARGVAALNEERVKQLKEAENVATQDATRKAIRTAENERAKTIAALPPPPPSSPPHHPIPQKDVSEVSPGGNNKLMQTPSVPSSIQRGASVSPNDLAFVKVIKVSTADELDAHAAAKLDKAKQAEVAMKKQQEKIEQSKKERLRFLKAKSQLELQQDYNRIMDELEELVKQEEVCSEPDLLLGLEKENTMLKHEQEAIVEELFSRLGLSLVDYNIAKDSRLTSYVERDTSSSNYGSKESESVGDDTPTVLVVAQDSSAAISQVTESFPDVRTEESSLLQSDTTISNDIYGNSYPMEGSTSISGTDSKTTVWNEMTPVNATVERFPTSGSTVTTVDETILAGHLRNHALGSSKNIPVLPSLDSSDSKTSKWISPSFQSDYQSRTLEKTLNDSVAMERSRKRPDDIFEVSPPNISLTDSSESTNRDSVKSNVKRDEQQMQAPPSLESEDTSRHFKDNVKRSQTEKPNIMDDKLRRLALSSLLANKKLATSQNRAKNVDVQSHNKFCNVEVRQTNRDEAKSLAEQSSMDSSISAASAVDKDGHQRWSSSRTSFHIPASQMAVKPEFSLSNDRRNFLGSVLKTQVSSTFRFAQPSISGRQMESSSFRYNANAQHFTPDALSFSRFSLRPALVKPHFGKMEPMRDLSTITEMDTPRSSQNTCWQQSSTLSISNELEFSARFSPKFEINEPGITEEPDLTLVGSDCSTCSPNRSHVFEITGITPSTDPSSQMSDLNIISERLNEDQNDEEIKRHKRSAFITNTKRRETNKRIIDSDTTTMIGGPSFQKLSYFLRDLSSDENSHLDSYSTSIDSSRKEDWSTPTLSSSESHSCFSAKIQTLPVLSTPSLESLSGNNLPSFFTQHSNPSEIKSGIPTSCEDMLLLGSSRSYLTSALDSTMDNCTDSLLSFMVHERNADLANLSTLDTICTDVNILTGGSSSESKASNGNASLLHHSRYLFSRSGSMSDSMFSFLRHELSADDSSFSGVVESTTSGLI